MAIRKIYGILMAVIIFLATLTETIAGEESAPKKETNIPNVKLSENSTKQLYGKWAEQAIGSLMAALATQIELPPAQATEINQCYDQSGGVIDYAKCLDRGIKTEKVMKYFFPKRKMQTTDPKFLPKQRYRSPATPQYANLANQFRRTNNQLTQDETVKNLQGEDRSELFSDRNFNRRMEWVKLPDGRWTKLSNGWNGWKGQELSRTKKPVSTTEKPETGQGLSENSVKGQASSHTSAMRLPKSYLKALRRLERVLSQKTKLGPVHRQKRETLEEAQARHLQTRKRLQEAFQKARSRQIGTFGSTGLMRKTPGAMIAEFLTEQVRKIKKGDEAQQLRQTSWQETYGDIKQKIQTRRKLRQQQEKIKKTMKKLISAEPIEELDGISNSRRPLAASFLDEIDEKMGNITHSGPTFDTNGVPETPKLPERKPRFGLDYFNDPLWPINVMRDIYFVAKSLNGGRIHENATFRALSPKFFNLFPENETEAGGPTDESFLSPSILSFHEEGLVPLPKLLQYLTGPERDAWIDFVVEASGATDAMEDFDKAFGSDREIAGLPSRIFSDALSRKNATDIFGDVANTVLDAWQHLYQTYSPKQVDELNTKGFAFLDKDQLHMMYGPDGILNGTAKPDFDIDSIDKMTDDEKQKMLHDYVEKFAAAKTVEPRLKDAASMPMIQGVPIDLIEERGHRSKRKVLLTPIVLEQPVSLVQQPLVSTPITLSPLVLSPIILSPSVLGPITLSPWVLNPLILSPRVLSPFTLTPTVGAPFILSPLVLHSLVLSPGVMDPFILNPFVLTPLILSPEVMNPKILSPFVLSPLILSPGVMNPLVLSPFVLSPLILSPQDLFALVLSPRAYSPLIKSKLKRSKIVLSPSAFS